MYDQDEVYRRVIEAGNEPGPFNIDYGLVEDESALYIEADDHRAFFSPSEARNLLRDVVKSADHKGWLHDPETVWTLAQINDLAKVLDSTHEMTADDYEHRYMNKEMRRYDYDADPDGLKNAIQEIYEH